MLARVTFGILTLIVLAGLAGPLLSAPWPSAVPVLVGELAAGVVIGKSGFGWLDATDPTTAFLGNVGFAMLMFAAGMHVPLRNPSLLAGLRRGGLAAVLVAVLAVPGGLVVAAVTGTGQRAIFALLLATGSAAIVAPILDEQGLLGDAGAEVVLAQVAVADVCSIVAVPLVLQPSRAGRALLASVLVAAAVVAVYLIAHYGSRMDVVRRTRRLSKHRGWALDLRLALVVLFALAYLAVRGGTSILVAGFGAGLAVAALGGPKRLSRQVTGIGAGFFVPLFFVVLGARLDLRALAHAAPIELAVVLLALNVGIRLAVAAVTRQPLPAGLVATAQLGVPAAVVALGLELGVLAPGQGAAILAAALATLATCALGVPGLHPSEPRSTVRPVRSPT
jgi:Kef-type K+ transport system membrane component KefB